jgi:hypothetical protein
MVRRLSVEFLDRVRADRREEIDQIPIRVTKQQGAVSPAPGLKSVMSDAIVRDLAQEYGLWSVHGDPRRGVARSERWGGSATNPFPVTSRPVPQSSTGALMAR